MIALFGASCDCGFGVGDSAKEVKCFLVTKRVQNRLDGVKIAQIGTKFQCASLSFSKIQNFHKFTMDVLFLEKEENALRHQSPVLAYICIYIYICPMDMNLDAGRAHPGFMGN